MKCCPRCGSPRFHYEIRSAGTNSTTNYYRTGSRRSWLFPSGIRTYNSQHKHKSVGICPECGYREEIIEKGCLYYLICLIFFPISLSIWFCNTKLIRLNKKWRLLFVASIWAIVILSCNLHNARNANNADTVKTENVSEVAMSVWSDEYADLSDFKYYIDSDMITLKSYEGKARKIKIAPSYDIDGVEMPVVALDRAFALDKVESVIVPEGVTSIAYNAFNSCGVKYLYIPSTLTDFTGWNYFHDVEKIYYGGTQEDWDALYTGDRSQLDVVQVICDADVNNLPD